MSRIPIIAAIGVKVALSGGCSYEWKMVSLRDGIFVDPTTDEHARAQVVRAYADGTEKVRAFYGELRADLPDAFVCNTDSCRVYFTGPAMRSWNFVPGQSVPGGEFVAARRTVVVVSIDERMTNVFAHEISHVELEERISPGRVPEWFNEGLATYLSGEPACASDVPNAVPDLRSLSGHDAWVTQTNDRSRVNATYCQALREFTAWIAKNGVPGLSRLCDQVKAGLPFAQAHGPMAIAPRQ